MNSMTHFKVVLFTPLRWIRGFGWAFFRSILLEVKAEWPINEDTISFNIHLKTELEDARTILCAYITKILNRDSIKIQNTPLNTCICWSSHEMVTSVKSWSSTRHFNVKLAALSNSFQHKLNFWVSILMRRMFSQTASKCKARVGE